MTTPAIRTQAELPAVFHEVVGHSADVLYTIARYQEMGALMNVERLESLVPGQERARVHVLIGTPILPIGPEDGRERWEIGDYFIASLMVLRYLLYTTVTLTGLWVAYQMFLVVHAFLSWFGANSAMIASTITGILVSVVLMFLLSLLKGRGGCAGIHCGGCKG